MIAKGIRLGSRRETEGILRVFRVSSGAEPGPKDRARAGSTQAISGLVRIFARIASAAGRIPASFPNSAMARWHASWPLLVFHGDSSQLSVATGASVIRHDRHGSDEPPRTSIAQSHAQEPGPRGSPHRPQPPGVGSGAASPPVERPTLVTESTRSTSVARHAGHAGCPSPNTSSSNPCSHLRHTYS